MTTRSLTPDCPACAPSAAVPKQAPAPSKLPLLALLPGALAALAPKCPLCLAAYLSAFGVSLGMASFTLSVLRPLALVSAAVALGMLLLRAARAAGR